MQLIKTVLLVLITSVNLFGAEYQKCCDEFYQLHVDHHKDIISKGGDLFSLYNFRIRVLYTLAYIDKDTQDLINAVINDCKNLNTIVDEHSTYLKKKTTISFDQNPRLIEALQQQAKHLSNGLHKLKHENVKLRFKIAADCLSRIVELHCPKQELDWKQEPPMRQKTMEEIEHYVDTVLLICKSKIAYERAQDKSINGWLAALLCPVALFTAYCAAKKPSLATEGVAAGLTAWASYHGYTYIQLCKSPYPTDKEVHKRAAICLDPKFE